MSINKIKKILIIMVMFFLISIISVYAVEINGYNVVGTLEIPEINLKIPILEKTTKASLEIGVSILYGPEPNQLGNTVIIGHNYLNGTFFSDLNKLKNGSKMYITDTTNKKIEYEVYNTFETTPEDTSFYTRATNVSEITLSTVTNDSQKRFIVFAKEIKEVENTDANTNSQWETTSYLDSISVNSATNQSANINNNNSAQDGNTNSTNAIIQNTNSTNTITQNANTNNILTNTKVDNTTTTKSIPNAGKEEFVLAIIFLLTVISAIIFYNKEIR